MANVKANVFKTLVLSMAGLILVFYGVGFLLASEWHVETTRTIAAPPAKVAVLLGDFATWQDWSQTDANLGPQTRREVSGAAATVGHTITWTGARGEAQLRLAEVGAQMLRYDFLLGEPGAALQRRGGGTVRWRAADGGTEVTWRDEGTVDLTGRWFAWFGALQERMRQVQTSSLSGLEQAATRP